MILSTKGKNHKKEDLYQSYLIDLLTLGLDFWHSTSNTEREGSEPLMAKRRALNIATCFLSSKQYFVTFHRSGMPFDKKYVAYETLTMIKNKHIVHHTFQFQQTGIMAFF